MSSELEGKIALVTGASRGIGAGIATALAQAGADVAVNFLGREAEARKVCSEIQGLGRRSLTIKADVSVSSEVSNMVAKIEAEFGPISILVNNAGIGRPQPLDQITERDWDEILAVNLKSMFLVTQAVLPSMRKQRWGRIINLSSVGRPARRSHRPPLCGFEGWLPRVDPFLCSLAGQGGHYRERHRSGLNRN